MNRYQRELNRIPLPEETRQALLRLSRPRLRAPELLRDRAGFPTARQQKSSPRKGGIHKAVTVTVVCAAVAVLVFDPVM